MLTDHITLVLTDREDEDGDPKIGTVADIITRHIHFAVDRSRNLYYYHEGVYKESGEQVVREIYLTLLERWKQKNSWKKSVIAEIVEMIKVKCRVLRDKPPLWQVNFLNGIYDIEMGILLDHTPDWLSTIQIPLTYDKDATTEYWYPFLTSIFPIGEDLLLQVLAWFLIPHTSLQKTVMLLGEGSNGKGTFLRMVDHILGLENVSHVSLHSLESERFSRAAIIGKLVNLCGDLPVGEIRNVNIFKSIVGEDVIQVEYKGQQSFSYRPFCRMIFSANAIPKTNDDTQGYRRRWIIIPFLQTFQVNPEVGNMLVENLSAQSELSGLLNLLLPKLSQLIESGFTISSEVQELIDNFAPVPLNVQEYFEKHLELGTEYDVIPTAILQNHFCRWCVGTPDSKQGYADFTSFLKNTYPTIEFNKSIRIDGKVTKCYKGLKLKIAESLDFIPELIRRNKTTSWVQ